MDPAPAGRASPDSVGRTVLSFDFGARRIGVAVGSEAVGTAEPLATVRADCPGPDWSALEALIGTWQPDVLVVGRPASLDGTRTPMTGRAEAFARELGRRAGLAVELVDERLSSLEARARLREQRRSGLRRRRVRRGDIDSTAAQIILLAWLDRLDPNGQT